MKWKRKRLQARLSASVIKLHRAGPYLHVIPAVQGLDRYFFTVRHEAIDDTNCGMRVVRRPYPLVWPQKGLGGELYSQCYAGLEPMVREVLEAAGHEVALSGKRPPELPAAALENLAAFDGPDGPTLDLVQRCDRGLI